MIKGFDMKIVIVNTFYGRGSVGRITADLYAELLRSGDVPFVAAGRGGIPEGIEGATIGNLPDFGAHVLKNFFQGGAGFGSASSTKKFIAWLEEIKPDIIHLHNIHGFYLQTELLFSYLKKADIPVVWTLHDCWSFTGHCAYFDYVQPWAKRMQAESGQKDIKGEDMLSLSCDRWKEGCHDCPIHRSAYPYALFKDNSKKNWVAKKNAYTGVKNLTIVTPSHWLADLVGKSYLSDYPVEVIHNGIDLDVFRPFSEKELALKKKQYAGYSHRRVLAVANQWEERKGLTYFERLAQFLPANYTIEIVGLNKPQAQLFKQKYKNGRVLPITRTESVKALASLYRGADVYVNATLEDNFPTTNLEALACGTPVVTFDTGGSSESLAKDCGIVVPKGDFDALAAAIEQVCETHPFSEKSCRARAGLYDKADCTKNYVKLYKRLAGEGS